jgi:predicted nucleotidyltransferase
MKKDTVMLRAREGDLIRTFSNVVFDVKGTVHPKDRLIAFPRFIPSATGTRKGNNTTYGKVYSLGERFQYLKDNHPELIVYDPVFGETLCEVPTAQVAQHFQPTDKLAQLHEAKSRSLLEEKAYRLAVTLKEKADLPWSAIGISGSIMAGLTTDTSDIDPLVYGEENCRKAYKALQELREIEGSGFKAYTTAELKTLYDFRVKDTHMSFEDFQAVENAKPSKACSWHRLLHSLPKRLERNHRTIWRCDIPECRLLQNPRYSPESRRCIVYAMQLRRRQRQSA